MKVTARKINRAAGGDVDQCRQDTSSVGAVLCGAVRCCAAASSLERASMQECFWLWKRLRSKCVCVCMSVCLCVLAAAAEEQ